MCIFKVKKQAVQGSHVRADFIALLLLSKAKVIFAVALPFPKKFFDTFWDFFIVLH
jgi:hypothetical protein